MRDNCNNLLANANNGCAGPVRAPTALFTWCRRKRRIEHHLGSDPGRARMFDKPAGGLPVPNATSPHNVQPNNE